MVGLFVCDVVAVVAFAVVLAAVLAPSTRPTPTPRPGTLHQRAFGRRSVRRTLGRRVPRTGTGGRHTPAVVPGTDAQRRLDATMEFHLGAAA